MEYFLDKVQSEDKMKIFLNGGGDGIQTINAYKSFDEILDHTKPLLYIPLAMESDKYLSCLQWITNELKDLNIPNIEMINQASDIVNKNLDNYCAIFIGGGNTFKLLKDLKTSGAFIKIKQFIKNNGIIFGGSAGAIIFGKNLKSCALDDNNTVGLEDISGFDVLNGYSILCHYTNRTKEKDEESKKYLLELSKEEKIIALPEEDTIYINNNNIEVIGNKPYYIFQNGNIKEQNLRNTRLKEAEKIISSNEQIFGNVPHTISEIDSGFNNTLFDVDNKYIIKVCGNTDENKFEKENQFYIKNSNSLHIPKLYKYDNTKTITNSVYEIISKINGKTLYYYWYKMTEIQKEETIKQIVTIVREIHNTKCESYNWTNYIKSKIIDAYKNTQQYFSIEEQEILEKSFEEYDKYLIDNKFALIHNDLHFDNIIKNENGLYIIDFNDTMIAPIDYEFRLLYMCKETPWKWANSEMDPFQKPEDYTNIDIYIKKYYEEFSSIKYLDERMIIYRILNDISLLSRFNNDELKQSVITHTKELLKLK